jgi:RNA polymerase-binding protein DksA
VRLLTRFPVERILAVLYTCNPDVGQKLWWHPRIGAADLLKGARGLVAKRAGTKPSSALRGGGKKKSGATRSDTFKSEKPGSRVGSDINSRTAVAIKPTKLAKREAKLAAGAKFPTNIPVPPPPVPTDGKPRKNQAGLSSKELEHFRELLLAKRRELVGDMHSMETEALRSTTGTNLSNLPLHMADMGTDNYEQEFTLGLVEKDRNLLREINQALAKIQNGTYGICEGTGKPISKVRLEAQPWAKYSVEYARLLERGLVRR